MSLIVDEHREYLSDAVRVDVFRRAIAALVHPGSVVADIGSGTGILGLLALQAGAARVHSIEATGMIEVARSLAAANGFADRFHAHAVHSTEAALGERVDVCVGDFVGRFGFDAGIFEIYPHAREHLLRPGGALIPSSIALFIAPVEHHALSSQVAFWAQPRHGFDLRPARDWAVNTGYPVALDRDHLLGDAVRIATLPTGELPPPNGVRAECDLIVGRTATLHGLGGWCSAMLAPGVEMTNSPLASERIARRNVFLPLATPLSVEAGDRVRARLSILPESVMVTWSVEVIAAGGVKHERQTQSTLRGMLLSRDVLERHDPGFVPELTARGRARLTTLELCDGRRTLREVEDGVFEAHRSLFRDRGEAAAFVAEVVSGYANPARRAAP